MKIFSGAVIDNVGIINRNNNLLKLINKKQQNMSKQKRPTAVWKEPRKIPNLIIDVKSKVINAKANPTYFGTITPDPDTLGKDADILLTAESLVKTRTVGLAADRDIKLVAIKNDVYDWLAFTQSLANRAGDFATAIAIIQAMGFGVKVNGVKVKAPFAATNKKGAIGVVSLKMKKVKAEKGLTTYEWRYSMDAGVTWIPLLSGGVANQTIEGLESGASIIAQGRSIADNVASTWIADSVVVA